MRVTKPVSVMGQGNVGAAEDIRVGNEGIVGDEEDVFSECAMMNADGSVLSSECCVLCADKTEVCHRDGEKDAQTVFEEAFLKPKSTVPASDQKSAGFLAESRDKIRAGDFVVL